MSETMNSLYKTIDLHVHSTASDGTFSPEDLVALAVKENLAAFALTDHDTVDGIPAALDAAEAAGIECIPGVELSTDYNGEEVHVVGLYIDTANAPLLDRLHYFQNERDTRNEKILARLREEGYSITMEDVRKGLDPDAVITRANVARHLLETNQVPDKAFVFSQLIGNGCKCYVERDKITPVQAVELIKNAGGTAILAHPVLYKLTEEELNTMLHGMMEAGLDGMEVFYSENQPEDEKRFAALCEELKLLPSGGSDFHGSNKADIFLGRGKNNLSIPYEVLEKIKNLQFIQG